MPIEQRRAPAFDVEAFKRKLAVVVESTADPVIEAKPAVVENNRKQKAPLGREGPQGVKEDAPIWRHCRR